MTSYSDSSVTLADLGAAASSRPASLKSMRDPQSVGPDCILEATPSSSDTASDAADLPARRLQEILSTHNTIPELSQDGFEKLEKHHNCLHRSVDGAPSASENDGSVPPDVQAKAPQTNMKRMLTPKGELIYVGWDGPNDPADPRNWAPFRKWTISICLYTFTALVSITVSGSSIAITSIEQELNTSRILAILGGITLFTLTFGIAPLVLAPLSEVYGRKWVVIVSSLFFCIWHIPQALANNITCLAVVRFLAGIGGSTAVALVGGVLSDLYANEDRGMAMAAFSYAAFAPTGLGPIMGGWIVQSRGFRLIYWIIFALSGALTIGIYFIMKETRESILLSRKAKRMRLVTGDNRFVAQADEERASLTTIITAFSLWISFAWSVLYLLLISIPIVFGQVYNFSLGQTGTVFVTQIVGSTIGVMISLWGDRAYHRHCGRLGPEARMYSGMVGGLLLPIGCWIFTWTSYSNIHWIAPCIGITITYAGLMLIYLTTFNYTSDCWTMYASSALAAMNLWRNVLGAVFPLFGTQMYDKLGVQGAGSLIAGVATVLALVPIIAWRYGAILRSKSPYHRELEAIKDQNEKQPRESMSRV